MRTTIQLSIIVSGLLAAAACGSTSSPVAPSPPALPFRAGAHIVSFSGPEAIGLGPGPLTPACPGIGVAGFGGVATEVTLDQVGSEWRARPTTPAGGTFEMRFVPGTAQPGSSPREVAVSGTASGLVINTASRSVSSRDSRADARRRILGPTVLAERHHASDGESRLGAGDEATSYSATAEARQLAATRARSSGLSAESLD